jgi:hypothetical protein
MINHPERISRAHAADIASGKQRHISDFVELDAGDVALSAKTVRGALRNFRKYKTKGGEKIT